MSPTQKLAGFLESARVRNVILCVILFNAVILGMETSKTIMAQAGDLILLLDRLFHCGHFTCSSRAGLFCVAGFADSAGAQGGVGCPTPTACGRGLCNGAAGDGIGVLVDGVDLLHRCRDGDQAVR